MDREGIILFMTWQELARTILRESLPRAITCVTRGLSLYGDTISTNVLNDFTASILTSTYESLSKCPYVWIKLASATSLPKLLAISVKFFDKQSLTLQDLSSAPWIIKGKIYCLFSYLLKYLATSLKD